MRLLATFLLLCHTGVSQRPPDKHAAKVRDFTHRIRTTKDSSALDGLLTKIVYSDLPEHHKNWLLWDFLRSRGRTSAMGHVSLSAVMYRHGSVVECGEEVFESLLGQDADYWLADPKKSSDTARIRHHSFANAVYACCRFDENLAKKYIPYCQDADYNHHYLWVLGKHLRPKEFATVLNSLDKKLKTDDQRRVLCNWLWLVRSNPAAFSYIVSAMRKADQKGWVFHLLAPLGDAPWSGIARNPPLPPSGLYYDVPHEWVDQLIEEISIILADKGLVQKLKSLTGKGRFEHYKLSYYAQLEQMRSNLVMKKLLLKHGVPSNPLAPQTLPVYAAMNRIKTWKGGVAHTIVGSLASADTDSKQRDVLVGFIGKISCGKTSIPHHDLLRSLTTCAARLKSPEAFFLALEEKKLFSLARDAAVASDREAVFLRAMAMIPKPSAGQVAVFRSYAKRSPENCLRALPFLAHHGTGRDLQRALDLVKKGKLGPLPVAASIAAISHRPIVLDAIVELFLLSEKTKPSQQVNVLDVLFPRYFELGKKIRHGPFRRLTEEDSTKIAASIDRILSQSAKLKMRTDHCTMLHPHQEEYLKSAREVAIKSNIMFCR